MDGQLSVVLLAASVALALIAVAIAGVSLAFRRDPPEVAALSSQLRALDSDVSELADRVNHWMRRDAVRRARSGRDEAEAPPVPATLADHKAALRAKVALARRSS